MAKTQTQKTSKGAKGKARKAKAAPPVPKHSRPAEVVAAARARDKSEGAAVKKIAAAGKSGDGGRITACQPGSGSHLIERAILARQGKPFSAADIRALLPSVLNVSNHLNTLYAGRGTRIAPRTITRGADGLYSYKPAK